MATEDEFSVRVTQGDTEAVVDVAGEVDLIARDLLIEAVDGVDAEVGRMVIDLADVTFIDSGGLQAVLHAHVTQQEAGRDLVLRRPSPPVLRILEMTGIAAAMTIETDEARP